MLFVYLLIALSQIVLRRRTPPDTLRVKVWCFPALSILTLVGIVAVLVQMVFDNEACTQLWLSLLSWAVVLVLYIVPRCWRRPTKLEAREALLGAARRVLVLANKNVSASELFDVVQRVDAAQRAEYFVSVSASPADTGQAENTGPVYVFDATVRAAQQRLDTILAAMRDIGLRVDGELGQHLLPARSRPQRPPRKLTP